MPNWNNIITKSLRELKADVTFTRGAILRNKVTQVAEDQGYDFDKYLRDSKQKFSAVVEQTENIVVHKRFSTDMFVGLRGAKWPDSVPPEIREPGNRFRGQEYRNWFRDDIYEAFTRISGSTYWYFPDTDEFAQRASDDDERAKIAIPQVTLDSLLAQRRDFAEQQESKEKLIEAIAYSPNPLAEFQNAIHEHQLNRLWHNYKTEKLVEQITDWAKSSSIDNRPEWMDSNRSQEDLQSPQQLMGHFASFMTDDEIRSISVPFRAVEEMYRSIRTSTRNRS